MEIYRSSYSLAILVLLFIFIIQGEWERFYASIHIQHTAHNTVGIDQTNDNELGQVKQQTKQMMMK